MTRWPALTGPCDRCCSVYEESTEAEIVSFPVYRILFCAVGPAGSDEEQCFGFTCGRGEAHDTAVFQCHVFKCAAARAVSPPPSRHSQGRPADTGGVW